VAGLGLGEPIAMAAGTVALAVSGASWYIAPGMRFKQTPRMHVDQVHTFSGTGISVLAGEERGNLPWGFYIRATETKNLYVLLRNAKQGNFVPKSAFPSDEDEDRFRDLVADHIRTNWRR
ncbi:MAG: YcxB family protein, partial [Gemmatimonadales bacterium]